jgi:hypothetical protein
MVKFITVLLVASISFANVTAQSENNLNKEIRKQDSLLFDAFNRCDTTAYRKYLSDNLEFYHDLGGVHYIDEEMQSMREMCARNSHIRRELVKTSLEIHKLGENGALEIGVHRFFHTNPGQPERPSGTYKFIHVWQKKNNTWVLSRVISYDHSQMNNN